MVYSIDLQKKSGMVEVTSRRKNISTEWYFGCGSSLFDLR